MELRKLNQKHPPSINRIFANQHNTNQNPSLYKFSPQTQTPSRKIPSKCKTQHELPNSIFRGIAPPMVLKQQDSGEVAVKIG